MTAHHPETPGTTEGRPVHQVGFVSPVPVNDFLHYQFYRACPASCLLVCRSYELGDFDARDVEASFAGFWPAFDYLVSRRVDRITQVGIPVSALLGRARTLALIEEARRRSDVPVAADFEETIDALRALGARRVAVAAKWSDDLMERVGAYLAEAGIDMLGHASEAHSASGVIGIGPREGFDMALRLGRAALTRHPDAEALLLAGGAWLSAPALPQLEAEFGKPAITNPTATCWSALRQFRLAPRQAGLCRLLDGLAAGGPA